MNRAGRLGRRGAIAKARRGTRMNATGIAAASPTAVEPTTGRSARHLDDQRDRGRIDDRRGHFPAARGAGAAWHQRHRRLGDQQRRGVVHRLLAGAADPRRRRRDPGAYRAGVRPDRRLPRRLVVLVLQLGGQRRACNRLRGGAVMDQPGLRRAVVRRRRGGRSRGCPDPGQCQRSPLGRRARAGHGGDQAVPAACGDGDHGHPWRPAARSSRCRRSR